MSILQKNTEVDAETSGGMNLLPKPKSDDGKSGGVRIPTKTGLLKLLPKKNNTMATPSCHAHGRHLPIRFQKNAVVETETSGGVRIPTKTGVLKLLPKKNSTLANKASQGRHLHNNFQSKNYFSNNSTGGHRQHMNEADFGCGTPADHVVGSHDTVSHKNIEPQHQLLNHPRKSERLPSWLKASKSKTNLNKWIHWITYGFRRKDNYYKHMDYAYTFRSKSEVTSFLDTGAVKGKVLQKKRSAERSGDPSGQDCGPSRSTRMTRQKTETTSISTPQDTWLSKCEGMATNITKLPQGFV